jgi:biotin transport system ATP-binding protein
VITFEAVGVLADATTPGAPDVTILEGVGLQLAERRVAVVGANGSGKSTLARLINGLVLPTSGRVVVDGLDTAHDGAAVRRRVGFVFTDPDAQLVMPTPREDVALSLRRLRLDAAERTERVHAVLDRFGLARHAEVSVHALSGGQKQLLALAGVLATEPAILVCDEPTTLLDLRWRRVVDELLDSLEQQVVLVTHDLDRAAGADRALVVDGGRIVADGDAWGAVQTYRDRMAVR